MHTEQWKQWQLWFCVFLLLLLASRHTIAASIEGVNTISHSRKLNFVAMILKTVKYAKNGKMQCLHSKNTLLCLYPSRSGERKNKKKKKTSKRMKCVSVDFVFYFCIFCWSTIAWNSRTSHDGSQSFGLLLFSAHSFSPIAIIACSHIRAWHSRCATRRWITCVESFSARSFVQLAVVYEMKSVCLECSSILLFEKFSSGKQKNWMHRKEWDRWPCATHQWPFERLQSEEEVVQSNVTTAYGGSITEKKN